MECQKNLHQFVATDSGEVCIICGLVGLKHNYIPDYFNGCGSYTNKKIKYSKISYCKQLLLQLQNNETKEVSPVIIQDVRNHFNQCIPNLYELRHFLKVSKQTRYYKHVSQILYKLTGVEYQLNYITIHNIIITFKQLLEFCNERHIKWSSVRHYLYLKLIDDEQFDIAKMVFRLSLKTTFDKYKKIWDAFNNITNY